MLSSKSPHIGIYIQPTKTCFYVHMHTTTQNDGVMQNVGRRISSAMLGRASERSGDWSSRRWKDNGNVADEPSKLSPTPEATAEEAVSRE